MLTLVHMETHTSTSIPVKLYRTPDLITLAAAVPGLGPGDLRVTVTPANEVVVEGALCEGPGFDPDCGDLKGVKEVLLDEWAMGPYRRTITLPDPVDGSAATITYGNGILVVAMPISERTHPATHVVEKVNPVRGRAHEAGGAVSSSTT